MSPIIYPVESFFYPYHLLTALVTGSIFFVILLILHIITVRPKETQGTGPAGGRNITGADAKKGKGFLQSPVQGTINVGNYFKRTAQSPTDASDRLATQRVDLANAISLGTLFLTLAVSGLYPFLNNPILDYGVSPGGVSSHYTREYSMTVANLGLTSAKNVLFSLTSHNTRFSNFTSQPFLGNITRSNTTLLGNALFSIPVIPPRSDTTVSFNTDYSKSKTEESVIPFLRSDEKVGYHDVVLTIFFYLGLGVGYVFTFSIMVFVRKLKRIRRKFIVVYMFPLFAYIILFTLIYTELYGVYLIRFPGLSST